MANVSINLAEWNDFKAQLETFLVDDQEQIVKHAVTVAVVEFDKIARDILPPTAKRRKVAQYWTEKQTRWWWWIMRMKALGKSRALPGWKAKYVQKNGRMVLVISGAYRRSGTLVKSLAYRVTSGQRGDGVYARAEYGSNRKSAPYVLDRDRQSLYHRDNWETLQGLLEVSEDRLVNAFTGDVFKELDRRLK